MLAMYDEKEILREYIEYEKYHAITFMISHNASGSLQ